MKKSSLGISLISLIITIIVIIILAAIVIFSGLGTPDSANLAKFTSEFADFNLAVDNAYMKEVEKNALSNQSRSKKQIYYKIATKKDVVEEKGGNVNEVPDRTGTVVALEELVGKIYPETLEGEDYYLITEDINVHNWKKQKQYFEEGEKHYLTDEGEAFFLPGYLVREDDGSQKWFINESKYYYGDKQQGEGGVVTPPAGGENNGEGGSGGENPGPVTEYTDPSGEGKVKILTDSEIGDNSFLKDTTKIEMVLKAEKEATMVPIPKGFSYVLGTGDSGLVVKDGSGNEFVWIPVSVTQLKEMYAEGEYELSGTTKVKTQKYGKGTIMQVTTPGKIEDDLYREPDLVTSCDNKTTSLRLAGFTGTKALENFAQDMVDQFDAMIKSVKNYGGFYVGRYELGYSGEVVCKAGVLELTASSEPDTSTDDLYYGSAETKQWHGLYKACKVFSNENVKSSMIWGCQWDRMVDFIGDSHVTRGPYQPELTGQYGDEAKHVHDTSTGKHEWTATASDNCFRASRGGRCGYSAPASYCDGIRSDQVLSCHSSRPQLYIQ